MASVHDSDNDAMFGKNLSVYHQPSAGEVGELVAWLREQDGGLGRRATYSRIADLLERLSDGPAVQSREPASVTTEPSDAELLELMPQQMRDDLAAAARALAGFDPDNIKAASVFRVILNRHVADHARAVLARWGNHPAIPDSSPQPIPVSERLPGPEDCDAEGRCWWFVSDAEENFAWERLENTELRRGWSHWLPAHALPLPSGEVEHD